MKTKNMKTLKGNPFRKGNKYIHNKQMQFVLSLVCLFAFVFAVGALLDPCLATTTGFGVSLATFMGIGCIDDVTDRDTSGNAIAYKVWLVNVPEQVDDTVSFPTPNNSREVATIPMKTGQYMRYFVAHAIPTFKSTGEKGDITTTGSNEFSIIMGGQRVALLNFIEQYAGGKFIVIFKQVGESQYYILGNADRPMLLSSYENKNDADGRYVTFTFKNSSIIQYHKYSGSIVKADAVLHTANATTLAVPSAVDEVTIPSNTAATAINAVSGLTDNDKGRFITLIGAGTTNPATIADGSSFVLEGGTTWTARPGSLITFHVLDTTTLVEVRGSRIQTA